MASGAERSVASIAIFWIFLLVSTLALGAGWIFGHAPAGLERETRALLADLHTSLGLTTVVLVVLQLVVAASLFVFSVQPRLRGGRETAAFWLRQILYVAALAAVALGALVMDCRGEEIQFWGYALPSWGEIDPALCDALNAGHKYAVYALSGAIFIYLLFAIFDRLSPAAPDGARAMENAAPTTVAMMIAEGLAHNFAFFGAAAFWLQLLFIVVSGLLLGFGFVGHSVSPDGGGLGEAIYWASAGQALLVVTVIFAHQYMKTAGRISRNPERYLPHDRRMAFWFVGIGGFTSILGLLISFAGVGLSVALLIGKTVSQPPGIAITDPHKIIRALDVFILLVNFNLLFAHFIGFGVAAWLSNSALKARHQFLVTARPFDRSVEQREQAG